jgi:hypothetical protein
MKQNLVMAVLVNNKSMCVCLIWTWALIYITENLIFVQESILRVQNLGKTARFLIGKT